MKTIYFIVLLSVFLSSCTKHKLNKNEICDIISEMNINDQKHRGNKLTVDPFFEILDSIKRNEGITNVMYKNFTTEKQLAYGKIARKIANKRKKVDSKIIDSLMNLQEKLDNTNSEILINLTKDYGFPIIDSLPCKQSPDLIFLHSQPKYFKEIKHLITSEYKKGRLNDFQYALILRHITRSKENDLQKIIEKEAIIIE